MKPAKRRLLVILAWVASAALPVLAASGSRPATGAVADGKAAARGHPGTGTVNSIDLRAGKVNLTHGPIPGLGWPGMTMDFVADKKALATLKPGQSVAFEVAERNGRYVITRIAPVGK